MFLCLTSKAQTLSPIVVSSSGSFYSSTNAMLSLTVAEMTMVETFSKPTAILTQGFQQAEQLTVSIVENIESTDNVNIYPNPTSGSFNIDYYALEEGSYDIKIIDMVGMNVFKGTYANGIGENIQKIDLSQLKQGIYLIELSHLNSSNVEVSSLYKINLVY